MCLISEGRGNRGEGGEKRGRGGNRSNRGKERKDNGNRGIMVRDEEWGKWKGRIWGRGVWGNCWDIHP